MDYSHLLDQNVNSANATQVRPVPTGEYLANIEDVKVYGQEIKNGKRAGQTVPKVDIVWNILDETLKASLERETVRITQDLWLDLDLAGNIDTGPDKNVKLGQIREALGLNQAGFALGQLKGSRPCMVKVTQRTDDNDSSVIYNGIGRVAAAR